MTLTLTQLEAGIALSGALNRETVPRLTKKQMKTALANSRCEIDFAEVTHVDTAGLAWVLLLVEKAAKQNCEISFINLPQDMVKLAKLSAVDTLFPNLTSTAQ